MNKLLIVLLLSSFIVQNIKGQDPHRFDADIERFNKLEISTAEDLVVFTGSSSIRFWKEADKDCSAAKVINTGFGGSQMSDLLYFLDQTVLRFKPASVFIYEGDNDINANKLPKDIIDTASKVADRILAADPGTKIFFIGAKPSPSRWQLKDDYLKFNSMLKEYCNSQPQLSYIDVWYPMLDKRNSPNPLIFIEDSLHMNRKGYLLWKEIVCEYTD